MKTVRTKRRRGEGYTEYVIVASFMLICSVTTFLSAGAGGIRALANEKRLCVIQHRKCNQLQEQEVATNASDPARPDTGGRQQPGADPLQEGAELPAPAPAPAPTLPKTWWQNLLSSAASNPLVSSLFGPIFWWSSGWFS